MKAFLSFSLGRFAFYFQAKEGRLGDEYASANSVDPDKTEQNFQFYLFSEQNAVTKGEII